MRNRAAVGQRLAALFLFGWLVFSFPLLSIFNVSGLVFGIPVLYAYLFCAWGLLIVLMMVVIERPR